jgi:putative transposase
LAIVVQTKQKEVRQVRIVPHASHYVVEVIYSVKPTSRTANRLRPAWAASLDLGIDVLAAVTSNKKGLTPFLVNGRPLKSVNAYYNKLRAALQAALPCGQSTSHRLLALTDKRNRKINHYLHWASRYIVGWMVRERLGTLIIGHNVGWKQEVDIGKVSNQNFVSIPHCVHPPLDLHPPADVQGPTGRDQGHRPRRELHVQVLLLGPGAHPQTHGLLWAAGEAR